MKGSIKFFVCNSGAGNGCATSMGAWNFCFLSAGQPPCQKGEAFLLAVGAFLLTVKLLCLQSLNRKAKTVSKKAETVSKKAKIGNCK